MKTDVNFRFRLGQNCYYAHQGTPCECVVELRTYSESRVDAISGRVLKSKRYGLRLVQSSVLSFSQIPEDEVFSTAQQCRVFVACSNRKSGFMGTTKVV